MLYLPWLYPLYSSKRVLTLAILTLAILTLSILSMNEERGLSVGLREERPGQGQVRGHIYVCVYCVPMLRYGVLGLLW